MSRLSKVKRGVAQDPARIYMVGAEGLGKSTLAACAPGVIFIDLEDGTGRLEIDRYSFRDEPGGHIPRSYAEVKSAVLDLQKNPHDYKYLAIDTADQLESLIWTHCLERDSGKMGPLNKGGKKLESLEAYGYGRGYSLALDMWRELCGELDKLRLSRSVGIILLGHTTIRTFKNPEGEDYDRYQPRIHDKAAGFLKQWSDVVGFCQYEGGGGKLHEDQPRAKGWDTGRRLIKLRRTAAYDAKSRYPMPDEVEMSLEDPWGPFERALSVSINMPPKKIIDLIGAELERIGDPELTEKVRDAVKRARDSRSTLGRYLGELKNRNPKEEETNATDA